MTFQLTYFFDLIWDDFARFGGPSGLPEAPCQGLEGAAALPKPRRAPNITFFKVSGACWAALETFLRSPREALFNRIVVIFANKSIDESASVFKMAATPLTSNKKRSPAGLRLDGLF